MTNAVWSRLRPKLESLVQVARNRRAISEILPKVNERMGILRGLYDDYVKTLKPSKRYLCPPAEILRPLPDVINIVESPADVETSAKDFEPIASKFHQILSDYYARRRDDFARIMKEVLERNTLNRQHPNATFKRIDLHPVDLVESIWTHSYERNEDFMIGWPALASKMHTHTNYAHKLRPGVYISMPQDPVFHYPLARFAAGLVSMVGLQPFTVSAAQMDERKERFTCDCLIEGYRKIFTWRSAVSPFSGQ